jgi:hypothetical protein
MENKMADDSISAKRAVALSTFSRLKDVVRELETNEKRLAVEATGASMEFKLSADDANWFVAYKTSAELVQLPLAERLVAKI